MHLLIAFSDCFPQRFHIHLNTFTQHDLDNIFPLHINSFEHRRILGHEYNIIILYKHVRRTIVDVIIIACTILHGDWWSRCHDVLSHTANRPRVYKSRVLGGSKGRGKGWRKGRGYGRVKGGDGFQRRVSSWIRRKSRSKIQAFFLYFLVPESLYL